MSVTMHQRTMGTSGAVRAGRRSLRNGSIGSTALNLSSSSSKMAEQESSSSGRRLPKGPGPLPNRTILDKSRTVRYIAGPSNGHHASSDRSRATTTFNHINRQKSSTIPSQTTRRKVSSDSGYGSSNGKERTHTSSSSYGQQLTSGRRSKSLSCLPQEKDFSRSRIDSSTHDISTSNKNFKPTLNYSTISSSSSIYRSTTHADYKDPRGDRSSSLNASKSGQSYSLDRSGVGKSSYSVYTDTTRKSTITARPGSDMMCPRKSSFSSSNSSPSNSPTGRGSSDGLVGLRNLGNTCFMNSILQCLSHTQPLTAHLQSKDSHMKIINSSSSMKGKLFHAFADLIKSMWKPGNSDVVSPHSFKTQIQRFAPRFMGYNQQDAQEFLRFLLEGLHDDLNRVSSKPKYKACEFDDLLSHRQNAEKSWKSYLSRDNSLMTDLFVGQLKSMLKCCSCDYTSVTFDPFWDLSLPIPRKSSGSSSSSSWSSRRSSSADDSDISIRDCIQSFTKEEVLDGDERPTCDKCKTKRKSTKKFSIQRFPPILVLHLKRFSGFSFRSKLQTNVDFPLTDLDLAEFAAETQEGRSAVYSLYAVSNHSGGTYGGHYIAYCRHPISKQWHCFNDSRVDEISSYRVRGPQAYILFYEKVERKSSL